MQKAPFSFFRDMPTGYRIAIGGCVAVLTGFLLPWLSTPGLEYIDGFATMGFNFLYIFVLISPFATVFMMLRFYLRHYVYRWEDGAVVLGIGALASLILLTAVSGLEVLGIGWFMTLAGTGSIALGGFLNFRK